MKYCLLPVFIFGMSLCVSGQVMFRNDFILGPHKKVKNKGLTFITFNLNRHQNLNTVDNTRGAGGIVIDVEAIRNPQKVYTYSEIAEKIYTPSRSFRSSVDAVPMFLLLAPPTNLRLPFYSEARPRRYPY